ncbi:MAG: hypothetical protein NTV04_24275, partial [Deltaproteobacteria bacterium]|nr:hypothetical protein [Deltaproteobacteria bacterium]
MFDMGYIKSPWLMKKLSLVNHLILRRANRIITIGKWMARKIQRNYEIEPSSIEIVENWALDVAYSAPTTAGPFVILYTGNIGLAHDFSYFPALLNALGQIENIEIRFIGAGRQSSLATKMLEKHSKIRHTFSGYVERSELDRTLASGHMFLIAQSERAVGDILPSKLYSYIAAGRPLLYLGTRKSEIGELIGISRIGAIIECRNDLGNAVQMIKEYERRGAAYLAVCERVRRLYNTE